MKLSTHYNKASIIVSVSVLLVSAVIYYVTINQIARRQLDDNLSEELGELVYFVNVNNALPKTPYDQNQISYAPTKLKSYTTHFFDAPYVNTKEKEVEKGRGVNLLLKVKGQNFMVTIIESSEDAENLVQIISLITVVLTCILLSILFLTNRYLLNGLWRPFYNILDQVKRFNLADRNKVIPVETKVTEFSELSEAVVKMASRAAIDYQGLKSFTENASHEMNTPLAVITSKLDTLIQDETLRSDQYEQITDIYAATSRLSRLNQSLLLLVKIDNNLIEDQEQINMRTVIAGKAHQFQELIKNKNIELELSVDDSIITASRYLVDVLVNNLFSNAIRHNTAHGQIRINLSAKKLFFQNTGEPSPLDEKIIFERFNKGKSSDGTGLGLSIIKNICGRYKFKVSYSYVANLHSFEICFA